MVDPDFDDSVLHPVDRTPKTVRTKRANSELAYKHDDCIPYGGIVHMGFFFDGFARHRDMDDPDTSHPCPRVEVDRVMPMPRHCKMR